MQFDKKRLFKSLIATFILGFSTPSHILIADVLEKRGIGKKLRLNPVSRETHMGTYMSEIDKCTKIKWVQESNVSSFHASRNQPCWMLECSATIEPYGLKIGENNEEIVWTMMAIFDTKTNFGCHACSSSSKVALFPLTNILDTCLQHCEISKDS